MIIAFGSFIWHVVLDLIGIIIAIILLFIIGDAVYVTYQQYMKHRKAKMTYTVLNPKELKELQKVIGSDMAFIDKTGNVVINRTKTKDGDSRDKNNSVSQ